jgi:hypothetical protein
VVNAIHNFSYPATSDNQSLEFIGAWRLCVQVSAPHNRREPNLTGSRILRGRNKIFELPYRADLKYFSMSTRLDSSEKVLRVSNRNFLEKIWKK